MVLTIAIGSQDGLRLARLRLFGGFGLETEQLTTTTFRSNRVVALLAYLALHPSGKATREELADRLWPQLEGPTGRNNLRITLQYLKHALTEHELPDDCVVIERNWISINPDRIVSDVQLFRESYHAAQHAEEAEAAVRLLIASVTYASGPVLPELYDDWFEPMRAEITEERFSALCDLATLLLPIKPAEAAAYARQACAVEPLSPRAPELAATAYLAIGDKGAATHVLRKYGQICEEELGSELPTRLAKLLAESERVDQPSRRLAQISRPASSFHGREAEMAQITAWLKDDSSRLLTVYGPGGIGKTRLALESAAKANELGPVLWVELAHITTGDKLLESVARAAGPLILSAQSPIEQIIGLLAEGSTFIILDNVEQIPDSELHAISTLLQRIPTAKILVTSRKTLGLPCETLLRLRPLALPEGESPEKSAAYQLFIDRAKACRANIAFSEKDSALVVELAKRLEGIPLAIELAAARLTALGMQELVAGIAAPLDFLVSPRRSTERHGALRTTLQWSFAQLQPEVARAISRFGGLRGTWDRGAAQALVEGIKSSQPVDQILQTACEHSVLEMVPGPFSRYRMLECTRQYAWECLSPWEQAEARALQANHFCEIARSRQGDPSVLEEMPNLEASLSYFAESQDRVEGLLRISEGLMWLLIETSLARTALQLLEAASLTSPPGRIKAGLLLQIAYIQLALSRFAEAVEISRKGAEMAVASGDRALRSEHLSVVARGLFFTGPFNGAKTAAREAIEHAGCDPKLLARGLQALARVLIVERAPDALHVAEEALIQGEIANDKPLFLELLDNVAAFHMSEHRLEEAEAVYRKMEVLQDGYLPNGRRRALLVQRMGELAAAQRHFQEARDRFEEALDLAYQCQNEWVITQSLTRLGDVEYTLGNYQRSLDCHLETYERRKASSDTRGIATSVLGAGTALLALGREDEGYRMLQQAIATVDELDTDFCAYRCLLPCAEAALRDGQVEAAQRIAARTAALIRKFLSQGVDLHALEISESVLNRADEIASPAKKS